MNNRLQFRHHTPIFDTREEAIEYIYSQVRFAEEGLAFEDKSYGYSLFAEPLIIRYKNEEDEGLPSGATPHPHVILAIGSNTNDGGFGYGDNRFCIIDVHKTEEEIEEIWEEIETAIKGLTIYTKDSNTLKLHLERSDSGSVISGDVAVAAAHIFDDARKPNIIMTTDNGLFTYVNMDYDKDNDKITFTVNGDKKEWLINNNYLVSGWYSKKDESLHLKSKDESEIVISLENLIDEWGVEGEASNTPIVLTREEVGYGDDSSHSHVEPWQDVLKADVRLADRRYNVLKRTSDGRYLYVDGLASNITFFKDGEEITVQEALTNVTKGASNDSTNIIYEKADGFYATAMLKYLNKENKLVFTTSNVTGGTNVEEISLNAVKAFEKIYYDSVTESLIILYLDGNGDIQEVDVPIGQMMQDWEWDIQNEGHNVKLHKQRVVAGNDKVSADAAIYNDPDNILVDKNHELFVKGTADNIRYGRGGNVSDELDKLNNIDVQYGNSIEEISGKVDTLRSDVDAEIEFARGEESRIEAKVDNEVTRSTAKDTEHDRKIETIEQTIGDGFSVDGHETVTYKFNELSNNVTAVSSKTDTNAANLSLLSAKTEAEVVRAKGEEQRIEKKFDDELGEGFNVRNTVRDQFIREKEERIAEDARLQGEIESISASTNGKLVDVINNDHSINVDKSDAIRPVIKVNLSEELIDGKPNIIKLNNDGLYAGVDLTYSFDEQTGANTLYFSTTNGSKRIELKTNSVVDKIYYDPSREAIIIEYTVNGHRMPDVVVPVGDLISEWRVSESTDGAIKLSLQRVSSGETGKDILYAESIISNHEDNILINDNGALYVSGADIESSKADIEALKARMTTAENDIDALEDDLAAEIIRATNEEQRIEGKLDREVERATNEDANLWEALRAEISRSTEKDNEHDTVIANEITRATTAEHALHDEIVAETTSRISGDTALRTSINEEETRATNAEQRLKYEINLETERASNTEANILDALQSEILRSTTKDNEHDTAIANEISRAIEAERALSDDIAAEVTRATSAETELNNAITSEVSRSTAKDNEHDASISSLRNDLDGEIASRTTADNELTNLIHQEEDRAKSVESGLSHSIEVESIARQNGDNTLLQRITTEEATRQANDEQLQTNIDNEASTRSTNDTRIENALNSEISRSTTRDENLQEQITAEANTARSAESSIRESITTEVAARTTADADLQTQISNEVSRATSNEDRIEEKIDAEKEARETEDNKIWAKIRPIEFKDTTTVHNERVRNEGENPDEVRHNVIISQADNNIIVANDTFGGVFSTARLGYNQSANLLTIYGPNDKILNSVTLGPGSIINDISYDQAEKDLVITYRRAGESEDTIMRFPVADLFNEWEIKSVEEGAALKLYKETQTGETGNVDLLWGRVLLAGAVERPDGTIDYGDNIIRIVNNGLYASGSAITEAKDTALCTRSELRAVEKAVLGSDLSESYICGSGFTYSPYEQACFINAAESMYDADKILDNYVCSAHTRITEVEEDVECLWREVNITQENVLGFVIPQCGMNTDGTPFTYPKHVDACIISEANNMNEADVLLDRAICEIGDGFACTKAEVSEIGKVLGVHPNCDQEIYYPSTQGCLLSNAATFAEADQILEDAVCNLIDTTLGGSETPTASLFVVEDGRNKNVAANVRLSRGNDMGKWQGDDELIIKNYSGDCIESEDDECIKSEFTDTNVLRIVDLTEMGYIPEVGFNGLYLSNIWDCGKYTLNGEGTPDEKYKTDESEAAQNHYARRYRNGVRYQNV